MIHIKRLNESDNTSAYKWTRDPNLPKGSGSKTLDMINQMAYRISLFGGTNVWWDSKFRLFWAEDTHKRANYCIYEIRPEYVILKDEEEKYPNLEMRLDNLSEIMLKNILQAYIEECKRSLTDKAFDEVMRCSKL